jgi:soluble lytic murein transglycosylase
MVMFAVVRHARTDPRMAAEFIASKAGQSLPVADRSYLWGRIAFEAAKRLLPEAAEWYERAGDADFSDEHLAWKARAALRAGNWAMVAEAIDAMTVAAHSDPAWTYWYARSLAAQGKADGARAYFLRISGQPDFYGLLASEDLGQPLAMPAFAPAPTEEQVAKAKANPGLTRALELFRLNLRTEGVREWVFSIRSMDDAQLLAAAELARRTELYDRAINTADRTTALHDYKVRFLAPFRETYRAQSLAFGVEEAWLYGLTRQESRFIANAKSSAGAQGLMQLMPTTARWVAQKIGLQLSPGRVIEVDTNVTLGARYVKLVLDDLGHPVMASAAYNAGPGRARRWRDVKPLEGAIYAESIPFNETRDYVKKVMANTFWYATLMEGKSVPLKARLGTIPAKASGDKFNEDLP